ncbi:MULTISPECIES: hypothetical protein [Curtobacterium]|uniref:hypothetical protein n=1 Tax=Curtobacterium flaccumfaciens TaxID=2035 RepID=UPI003EE78DD2
MRALQETLRGIDRSFSEEAEKDRARALMLIGAVGELSDACLRSLRVGDVLAEPGDGLRISNSSAEVVWIPLIRHAEFCPACSLVRWLRHVVGSEASTLTKWQSMHVCVIGTVYPPVELERSPLFRRSVTGEPEALTVPEVTWIIDDVLHRAGQSRNALDGLRDALMMTETISSL